MEFVNSTITNQDLADKITKELYALIGKRPPVSVIMKDGKVYRATVAESWKEGTSEDNYMIVALTDADKQKIRDAVAANYPNMVES